MIALPKDVIGPYRLDDDTAVSMIETRDGILLVPLTDDPMSESLRAEIEAWQAVGIEGFELFPYESDERDCGEVGWVESSIWKDKHDD